MRTSIKLALLGAATMLAGVGAFAQPAPGDDASPQPQPQGQPRMGRPDPEAHQKMLLEKYDANKDGKLDDAEFTIIGKDFAEGKIGPRPGQGQHGPGGFNGPNRQRSGGFGEPGSGGGPRNREDFAPGPDARGPQGRQFAQRGPRGPESFGGVPENFRGPRNGGGFEHGPGIPGGQGGPRGPRNQGGFGEGPGFAPDQQATMRPNLPLSGERLEAFKQELLKKYDANKDGKLSDKERTAIGKDIEEGKLPPPPSRPREVGNRPPPPQAPPGA